MQSSEGAPAYECINSTQRLAFKHWYAGAADIAQWIRLRLPSCSRGFEPQVQHLYFSVYIYLKSILYLLLNCENKQKGPGLPYLKKTLVCMVYGLVISPLGGRHKTTNGQFFLVSILF